MLASIISRIPEPVVLLAIAAIAMAVVARAIATVAKWRGVHFDAVNLNADAKTLVVIAPGFRGNPRRIRDVVERVRVAFPGAEIMLVRFAGGLLSNVSAYHVSDAIERQIRARQEESEKLEKIVLVGYSMGALLMRKAFVWGHGGSFQGDRRAATKRGDWVDLVERIILIAGMNRGWSTSRRDDTQDEPTDMVWYRRWIGGLAKTLARLSGVGKLLLATERGAAFVADLRVQWIDLARGSPHQRDVANHPLPPQRVPLVVQLLSVVDGIVSVADNADVTASTDFIFRLLPHSSHAQAAQMGPTWKWWQRKMRDEIRACFDLAVTADRNTLSSNAITPATLVEDPAILEVLFVMHGIRDVGFWTDEIQAELDALGNNSHRIIIRSGYGRFAMGAFLILGARQRYVRWFIDRYTEARAKYPKAEISYFGHSNGTYLLASALEHCRSIRVARVLFAGSVVRRSFNWNRTDDITGERRVGFIRNIVATSDWVVGWFPRLYEQIVKMRLASAPGFFDLGSAGFLGFADMSLNIAFVRGAHSAAIKRGERARAIAQFFAAETDAEAEAVLRNAFAQRESPNPVVAIVSNLCPLLWAAIIWALWQVGSIAVIYGATEYGIPEQWGAVVFVAFVIALLGLV